MGMPKKKTRRIVVDGVAYRWKLVPPGYDREGWMRPPPRSLSSSLFFQADGVPSCGQVCRVPVSWREDVPVTPEAVAMVVRLALAAGWDPGSRDSSFAGPGVDILELRTKEHVVREVMSD